MQKTRKNRLWLGAFGVLLGLRVLSGCASSAPERPSTRAVSAVTPTLAPIVAANNDFTWSLYGALASPSAGQPAPGNLFFSPFGIYTGLGMTYAGAAGDTAAEIRAVLGIQSDDATFHTALGALALDLNGEHEGRDYQLYVANDSFIADGYPILRTFLDELNRAYRVVPQSVPFALDPDTARRSINGWVSTQTQDTLPELFPDGAFDDGQTRLVLANAVYFEADWASGFDPAQTAAAPFHAAGGDVSVQTMTQTNTFSLTEDADTSALELDYRDDELSMLILVPSAVDGLGALEGRLNQSYVDGLLAQSSPEKIELRMPRFDLRTRVSLAAVLSTLGMPSAFDPVRADFSATTGTRDLFLADVAHAAYVQVEERGTVAAAATGVVLQTRSGVRELSVDHPFVFLIRDKLTGAVLFAGRVTDPE